MNKIAIGLIALYLLLTSQPVFSSELIAVLPVIDFKISEELTETKAFITSEIKAKKLLIRLRELKSINKSNMNSFDLKILRKEIRSIKSEFRNTCRGLYPSTNSMLFVELLLII
jgi:hypothetical protein